MHTDDTQVGRILTRREALALLGAASAAMLAACAPGQLTAPTASPYPAPSSVPTEAASPTIQAATITTSPTSFVPSCIVRPALTEGPYFVDEKINRSDIRSDPSDGSVKAGAPLTLTVNVSQINSSGCTPLAGAQVDVWHCDALGVYSDASDPSFNTQGKKFLRGYQVTDDNGTVKFTTIYPGWYRGRAVHIHFKIRTTSGHEFTSQWFFDDALSDQVYTQAPYAQKGPHTLLNTEDGIYNQGGSQLVLDVKKKGAAYASTFDIGLQMS